MADFSKRDTTPELMDTEAVDFEDFRACLVQLTQANVLSLAYRPTLAFFHKLWRAGHLSQGRRLLILDAGSGYGDMTRKVDAWLARRGVDAELIGLDMNPWSARAAAMASDPARPLKWITTDLFDYQAEGGADIIMCSLFTHHLPDALLIRYLRWMEDNARIGWFINDLERNPIPYYALKVIFALTRRHRFMQHDGPVSVASAFKRGDWERYLKEAEIPAQGTRIESWMPFRLCVSRVKAV